LSNLVANFSGIKLRWENVDVSPVRESWKRLTDSRIDEYAATIPRGIGASRGGRG